MVVIRCADEAVVRNIHELPQIEDALFAADDVVDELLRGHARGLGLIFDLLAVLVGAGQEHDVIARQALVACHRVGCHGAVGVADVELVGGVVDGGRDIEFLLVHWCFPLFCPRRMKAGRNYLQSTTERAVFARFYRIFPKRRKCGAISTALFRFEKVGSPHLPPPGGKQAKSIADSAARRRQMILIVICRDMRVTNYSLRGVRVASALWAARHEAQRNPLKQVTASLV